MCRAPTGTSNENEEAGRKMGENLSEINRGPLLKKQRWREKKTIIEIPRRGLLFSLPFSMAELLYSPTFLMSCTPKSREGAQHYTGTFSPQSVLSRLSDLTRHIAEMTDAHLQASDKHLKQELSQRDCNTMCSCKEKPTRKS